MTIDRKYTYFRQMLEEVLVTANKLMNTNVYVGKISAGRGVTTL